MSTLTKLFVVLLVIVSLLQTAATVVFINQSDAFVVNQRGLEDKVRGLEGQVTAANAARSAAEANLAQAREAMTNRIGDIDQNLQAARQQLSQSEVRAAQLQSQLAIQQADGSRLTEALKTSETTKAQLQEIVTQMRASADQATRRIAELNTAVSDLTNRLDVTETERRYLQEQFSAAQSRNERLSRALRDAGVREDVAAVSGGTGAGAVPIRSVIRNVQSIEGMPWATISVGSADDVRPGMQFKVIDRERGDFLGTVTVDVVESNMASGRLTGPRVSEINAGDEAVTQL